MNTSPIVMLTHVRHAAITEGFVPAVHKLGHPVVLLTDHRLDHLEYYSREREHAPLQIIECDVFNPLSAIDALQNADIRPRAVFSNSDHLQTSTALVAQSFGLPGKDWRICYAAKNKAAMRQRLAQLDLPTPWFHQLAPGQSLPAQAPWPLIGKPREGVASQDVQLCATPAEARHYAEAYWSRQPNRSVLFEGFIEGPLFSLETLGDGQHLRAVGGFDTQLSPPPHFIEMESVWNGPHIHRHRQHALAQVAAFGIGFGVCHSEFALTEHGPVLIEINYRSIGDGCEFMLDRMFGGHWFEWILRLHLGQPLDQDAIDHEVAMNRQALLRFYIAQQPGQLHEASDTFSERTSKAQAHYRSLRQQGDDIRLSHSNKDYLGVLSAIAEDQASLEQILSTAESRLRWEIQPAELPA
jgi:biotin carboxylase